MSGEDFFKFNSGKEFRFSNFKEIKEEDLKGADEKIKKLFNIFAGDDKVLQVNEAQSLFNALKSSAGDNKTLETDEIKMFAEEKIGEEVDTNIFTTFVNNLFGTKDKTQNQSVQVAQSSNTSKSEQTFLEEAACKEIVIDIIDENLSEAYEILNSQYLGAISGWHDARKDKNDILKTSNVAKVLDYQNAGVEWMNKAKLAPPNGLTKKEYYEGNKQRIKDMILTRVLVLDTNTKFKELKNKYSEEKLAQIIGDYVEALCSNATMADLKNIQKNFVSYSGVEETKALENVVDNAIKFNEDKNKPMPAGELAGIKLNQPKGIIPEYWNSDEPISFEEVYKIERGTEYSQYKIEKYALAKKEMEVVANAYNKKQQFVEFAEGLRNDETLSTDEKAQKVLEGFADFYALSEDRGLSPLKELIKESKLPISIDENGFNFGTLDDNDKNRTLNSLLKFAKQSKEAEFEEFLDGKTIEEYQMALANAQNDAIGEENGKMMADAMKNDNLTCIQRWTGNTSMIGMGMTVVGGLLCFTPLAPLGAGMVTAGNTLAIGGMVAETGLGVADYATKDIQTAEEAEQLGKNFLMNAGGFIIGMGAGKAGIKAFNKLIDEKLVAVFGKQIAAGNKMQALKTVFTNPEYLKNFMTAAGAKLSADFVISYAGDLAMMGVLDTQDDWQSLLKANLTGILVGMSGDIKDVSGVGRPRNLGVSDGVKPMTEFDYGQRLLGNDVTIVDPKTGTNIDGTVTGLHTNNGQVEIEVNGQRYSTNDVSGVRGENIAENSLLEKAANENPVWIAEGKIKDKWLSQGLEETDAEVTTKPIIFENGKATLDIKAIEEFNQNYKSEPIDEVSKLIFSGKLNETLTKRYEEMGRVFEELGQKYNTKFNELAVKYKDDSAKYAEEVIKILSKEFGMEGFEIPVEFISGNGKTCYFDYTKGKILMDRSITNAKDFTTLLVHEFKHSLQFRDLTAQYGIEGVIDIIINDKSIKPNERNVTLNKTLNNPYNKRLLTEYNFATVQKGSVSDYLNRIYKDEFTDTKTTYPEYIEKQIIEPEAYYSSNGKFANNIDLKGRNITKPYTQKEIDALKAKGEIQETSTGNLFRMLENGSIEIIGKVLPAGINLPSNLKTIDVTTAKQKLAELNIESSEHYIENLIGYCKINDEVSEVLLNEAITLLKDNNADITRLRYIIRSFISKNNEIDFAYINKLKELIKNGTDSEEASILLNYCKDKNGVYSEEIYNKIMTLKEQDYYTHEILAACKIDEEIVETTWQKALELESLGLKNEDIVNIIKACRIKESTQRNARTVGFNDEAYSKAKLLFEEHKFESENISRIIERCTVDGKFSQECFDRAVSLHDKISESNIYDFVRYPNELLDFMLEIKDKYNIKEYKLDYILRECVSTVDGKTVASPICMSKAEELIAKYNFKADDVGHLLYASKVDGELDLKLYEEVIKMHQAGFNRIGSIIESLTTKGQNEGETSQVNYDLLQKTKEWKELGIEDDWISQYCSEFEGLKIDVNKHDLVKEYHSAEFKPNEIRDLLAANGNLENLSLTEFRDKVFELKKLGLDNNKIINLLNGIGMPNGWSTPKFKLSKQNLDMVIDMIQRGVKEPDRIVRASYENYELNQDILNTAYERIKDGISEDRLSCLNSMRRYFTEMPELEDVLINLSKTVREDYDYNSFYSLANNVYNEMYNSKSGKDVANNVIEALKKGAKEEDIKYILDTNYGDPVRINRDNLDKSEVISQIKTKLLNALVEHPENTEQIKDITNSVARTIVDGDLSELDFCLKYPDRYRDILRTEHPLDWHGNRRSELSNRARNLMLQFDSAGVPIDDVLKYTDILCKGTYYLDEPIPESTLNKIIELRNNQKLDDNTLKMIRHLPFVEKTPELIDYVMELKEKNLLPEFNEQIEYDISALVRILPNNSETGKLGLYENYKEILDFYVKNKDVLRYERVSGENHYITEFVDIVRNYKEHHSGIDKAMDLEPFKAMAEIVRKTSISPETINGIISNGYADKLKAFTDKVDLEKYSNELNLIFKQLNEYYNHSSYSDILNENISKRDLEYLLDMQKLMCENVKENETPQILDNRWFRRFIGEKEIPAEALDKLRYYIEMELADPNKHGRYISIDRYHNTVRLYENSPENIERIESIMYNKGFADGMYEHILNDLSSNPEILNKQLELIENILDFTGDLSGNKSYLQSDIISILRDAKTLEDVNVKIELWEQLKTQLQSKSTIQKFWDANIKKQNKLGMALMCVEGTNNTNKNAVLAAMGNKKYSNLIWNCARNIDKNNVALIEDIIKNDRLNDPDNANFAGIVLNTSINEFNAKFVQENFDIIPQEDLSKATSILSEINGNLIVRLYNDKELNFPKEHILDIAPYCNQMNIDLVTRLCTDKNLKFPADQIKDIARAINLTNNELAEKLCTDKSLKCPTDKIVDILKAFKLINVDTKSLSLSEKINTLGTISSMDKTLLTLCRKYSPVDIDAKIAELTVLLGKKKDVINISASQQRMFVQNILANNNQNAETVLKNFDFQQYGKQGLPLTYTRKQFADNIENLIKELSTEEQQVVLEHFGLIKGETGFDGLPTNRPFNNENVSPQVNEIAKKVQNEIEIFTARNKINTGDIVVDNVLNGLINGLPEFTSIVGKEQHGTHAYSVDIHTLKVLQSAMNNPLYERLTDRDKTILKIAALCHDLGKRGGVVDTGHASSSAEYVTAILDKFPFPQGMKDRIIDIVDNHHWFEAYNTGHATAEDVAVRCRRPEDFMIYEILAKADFENVNKDFHISRSEGVTNQAEFDKFMQDKMQPIDEALTRMYSRANLVFDTQFMQNGERFPRETIEIGGETIELKVLNLSNLKGNDSLQQYGFSTGVTKENARFTVHMTNPNMSRMESVMILTQNSLNQSAWSTSLIKASNNRTYCNMKFGFVLDVDQANISEANYENTGSGCRKGLETFKRILLNANGSARTYVKDHLTKELSNKGIELNDNEYAQLAKYLITKKYTTQITKDIKIGDKVIKASDLVECLEKSRDALFKGGDQHSEIVPINPRVKGLIAKVEKLEECPEEFLQFAQKHNLPIILMKATKDNTTW